MCYDHHLCLAACSTKFTASRAKRRKQCHLKHICTLLQRAPIDRHIRKDISLDRRCIEQAAFHVPIVLFGTNFRRYMTCLHITLPRRIKNLLSKLQGSNKDRSSSPEFFTGRNSYLERPSPALPQDVVESANPSRDTGVIQQPLSIHLLSRPRDGIIALPSPGSSLDPTRPLPKSI